MTNDIHLVIQIWMYGFNVYGLEPKPSKVVKSLESLWHEVHHLRSLTISRAVLNILDRLGKQFVSALFGELHYEHVLTRIRAVACSNSEIRMEGPKKKKKSLH